MRGALTLWSIGLVAALAGCAGARQSPLVVWANDGGDKVYREETRLSHGREVRNRIFDPASRTIALRAAGNEVVSFSIVIEAPSQALAGVTVAIDDLKAASSEARPISADPGRPRSGNGVFDWAGRQIERFYVRYLPIRGLSTNFYQADKAESQVPAQFQDHARGAQSAGAWSSRPMADKSAPEIAVPIELLPGGRFSVKQGESQCVWVDVYVPRDRASRHADHSPLVFTGSARVQCESPAQSVTLPITLRVADFSLPDRHAAPGMTTYQEKDLYERYFNTEGEGSPEIEEQARVVRDRHFLLAHRHKIDLIDGNETQSAKVDAPATEWLKRLDGTLFSQAAPSLYGRSKDSEYAPYEGPGEGVGNSVFVIGRDYGGWPGAWMGDNWREPFAAHAAAWTASLAQHARAWEQYFETVSPGTERYLYLMDEPSRVKPGVPEAFSYERAEFYARAIAGAPGPTGRALATLVTAPLPDIRTIMPHVTVPASTVYGGDRAAWQLAQDTFRAGRYGTVEYNGHRPAVGSFGIEDDGTALRELPWAQWKMHVARWYYWMGTYYIDRNNGGRVNEVYRTAATFIQGGVTRDAARGETSTTRGGVYSNGDGVLFYPGTDRYTLGGREPRDNYGIGGPIASLRLKHWRRGIQDADYLEMASRRSPAETARLVARLVPAALWENGSRNARPEEWYANGISWNPDPDVWEAAREELTRLIDGQPAAR